MRGHKVTSQSVLEIKARKEEQQERQTSQNMAETIKDLTERDLTWDQGWDNARGRAFVT